MFNATPLIFPQLGPVYQALFPWAEALLRAVVGLPSSPTGCAARWDVSVNRRAVAQFDRIRGWTHRGGYHPRKFWAHAIVLTQLVAGPMLALGLFTRLLRCRSSFF